jgi:hypothetical protein
MKAFSFVALFVAVCAGGAFAEDDTQTQDSTGSRAPMTWTTDTSAVAALGSRHLGRREEDVYAWIRADKEAIGMIESAAAARSSRKRAGGITIGVGAGIAVLGFLGSLVGTECTTQTDGSTFCTANPAGIVVGLIGAGTIGVGIGMMASKSEEEKALRNRYKFFITNGKFAFQPVAY